MNDSKALFVLVNPRKAMSYITTSIVPSQGFHPTSTNVVHFSTSLAQCSLYLYFKLPPLLFVDPHELALRDSTYTFSHWGSRDLEKPVHALPEAERSSEVLLNVKLPPSFEDRKRPQSVSQTWNVTVDLPMHLRYGAPASAQSTSESTKPYEHIQVDTPIAFLLCSTSRELVFDIFCFVSLTLSFSNACRQCNPPSCIITVTCYRISSKNSAKLFYPYSSPSRVIIYECYNRSYGLHLRSTTCRTWDMFNDSYMLLLACYRILEYFVASRSSTSSVKTRIEILSLTIF